MRVRVDAARHYILAAGIDDLCTSRRIQVCANLLNLSIRAQYVCAPGPFGCYNGSALD
jgi:hypothetical protein